jgi:hypothetical protein
VAGLISISDFKRSSASLEWHEAVALVAELAGAMIASGAGRVPAPESVFVAADGSLEVRDGRSLDGPPSQQLAALLGDLVSSARVPTELAQFVADNRAAQPARATVQDFAEALAFFEPPGRREIVKAMAGRAADAGLESHTEEELERLAARTRNAAKPADTPKRAVSPSRRKTVLLAGSLVAIAAVAGGVVALFAGLSKPGTVARSVRTQVNAIVDTGLEAVGIAMPKASPAPPPASAPATAAAPPRPAKPRKSSSQSSPRVQFTVAVRDLGGWPIPEAPPPNEPELSDSPVDSTVYNADVEGVEPAVLMRPHLPSQPPSTVSVAELGVLELVVGQTGAVDHVRLISRENRYQDRMIVAAAKTWRFQPATKDGAPVRSRVRIRVTL